MHTQAASGCLLFYASNMLLALIWQALAAMNFYACNCVRALAIHWRRCACKSLWLKEQLSSVNKALDSSRSSSCSSTGP